MLKHADDFECLSISFFLLFFFFFCDFVCLRMVLLLVSVSLMILIEEWRKLWWHNCDRCPSDEWRDAMWWREKKHGWRCNSLCMFLFLKLFNCCHTYGSEVISFRLHAIFTSNKNPKISIDFVAMKIVSHIMFCLRHFVSFSCLTFMCV